MNEKYLNFLDYVLSKLKNGRPSGISLRNLADNYKLETGITLSRDEQKEFIQIYDEKWFTKENIDRLKIKQQSIDVLYEYGSIGEYLKQKNQSSLKNDLRNNTNTQNSAPTKQPTKTATTIGGVMLAVIIAVVSGIIILIIWAIWGNHIVNFFKPLP